MMNTAWRRARREDERRKRKDEQMSERRREKRGEGQATGAQPRKVPRRRIMAVMSSQDRVYP